MLEMKVLLGVVMALVVIRAQSKKPSNGYCAHNYCYTVHTEAVDFNSALKFCQQNSGSLMTVRTAEVNSVISVLLTEFPGHFWIGLRHTEKDCTDTSSDLKGYSWITGEPTSLFTNWRNKTATVCSPRCVSLSGADPKWTESLCSDSKGYLCEYKNNNKCGQLAFQADVLYETPLGFSKANLSEVPQGSNATRQDSRTKHICLDGRWHDAPWSCEVFNGGCEHICVKQSISICTCPPGYMLQNNNISCVRTQDDPCKHAGCSSACMPKGSNYECLCPDGFKLGDDGKTCKDVDHCGDQRVCPGNNFQCINTVGGFKCQCRDGFLEVEGVCEDIDECEMGPCEHDCENTEGSYLCRCMPGYKVSSKDRDKCTLYCPHKECKAVACDPNQPFQCDCPPGFVLEERPAGLFCLFIEDCDICDQKCENSARGFICSCYEGFVLVANNTCVGISEGFTVTTSNEIVTPTSRTPSAVTAGGLLAITACTVLAILFAVCLSYHIIKCCKRMDSFTLHKGGNEDMHSLQQVTTEKYTKKLTIRNMHFNQNN